MIEQIARLEQQVTLATTAQGKIDALNNLAWEARDVDPDRARQLAEEAQTLTQAGEFSQAPYRAGVAHSLTVLSYLEHREGKLARSLAQAAEAITILESVQHLAWLPKLYGNLSLNHTALGNHAESVDYLLKQLTCSQTLGDENMEGAAYHDLALAYRRLKQYEQALAYLAKAQRLFERTDDTVGIVFVLFNQAYLYLDMEKHAEAQTSGLAALQLARATHYRHGELIALDTLGIICRHEQRLADAFAYYQEALAVAQLESGINLLARVEYALGEIALLQGDFAAAGQFAQAALASAEKLASDPVLVDAHRLCAKVYKTQGDYATALTHLEAVQGLTERIFNQENEQRLQALIVLHQTETARREAELLREKNVALEHEIAERKRTEQALIQAQKMESLGILAGGVAHDFNNLLTGMIGQNALALQKLPPDHTARMHLEKSHQAMQRAADLARQMLAYSGKGHFTVTDCDLNQVIRENLALLGSVTQHGLTFQLDLAASLPAIRADQSQLYQLLANLLINAQEAAATTIHIRTSQHPLHQTDNQFGQYTGQSLAPGLYVALTITDNGQGMDAETRQKLFDPFYTTKFVGRGLGLAAVLGIIRGHGGGVMVQSQPGQGTTFTLLLPALAVSALPVTPVSDTLGPLPTLDAALVIDDEVSVRDMLSAILAEKQLQVYTASDGASGLAQLRQHFQRVKVVLLDILMPDLSGWETLRQVRQLHAQLPVVLISGYPPAATTDRWQPDPYTHFLLKPFAIDHLLATVQKCLP